MAAQEGSHQLADERAPLSVSAAGTSERTGIHHGTRSRPTTHKALPCPSEEKKRSRSDNEDIVDGHTVTSDEENFPSRRRSRHANQPLAANWRASDDGVEAPGSLRKVSTWADSGQERKEPTREDAVESLSESPVPVLSVHVADAGSRAGDEDAVDSSSTLRAAVQPRNDGGGDTSVGGGTAAEAVADDASSQGLDTRLSKEPSGTSLDWLSMYAFSKMLSELNEANDPPSPVEGAVRGTPHADERGPAESSPAPGLPPDQDSSVRPAEELEDFAEAPLSCENYLLDDVKSFVAAKSRVIEDTSAGSPASPVPPGGDVFERRESLSSTEASAEKWNWPGPTPQEAADAAWDCLHEQLAWRVLRSRSNQKSPPKRGQACASSATPETEAVTQSLPVGTDFFSGSCTAPDSAEERHRDSRPQAVSAQAQNVTAETTGKVQEDADGGSFAPPRSESPREESADFAGGVSGAMNALFYSVSEGGLNSRRGTTTSIRLYPIVRGVSRDNTKRRWAVYWKGNRKYFYDKFYDDSYEAYLQAVEFRKQAKTSTDRPPSDCTAAASSCPNSTSMFFPNASSAGACGKTNSSNVFPSGACSVEHTSSTTTGVSGVCSASESLLSTGRTPSNSSIDDTLHLTSPGEASGALPVNRSTARVGAGGERSLGNSTECAVRRKQISPQALELYKSAVRLMLEDLTTIVVPTFIAVARVTTTHGAQDNSELMAEGARAVASLTLLQNLLQWHAQHVQKATRQEALTPFLTVLAPCLEGTQLPSQTTPYRQQCLLLDLLELHIRELLLISRNVHSHFRQEHTEQLFVLMQRLIKDRNSSRILRPNEAVPGSEGT